MATLDMDREFLIALQVIRLLSQSNRRKEDIIEKIQFLIANFIHEYMMIEDMRKTVQKKKLGKILMSRDLIEILTAYDTLLRELIVLKQDPSKNNIIQAWELVPQIIVSAPYNPKKIDIPLFLKTVNDIKNGASLSILDLENLVAQLKSFEKYKIYELYMALLSPDPTISKENIISLMNFIGYLQNMPYYESLLASKNVQEGKEIILKSLVAEEESARAKDQARQQAAAEAQAREKEKAEQAKQEREAAAAAEAAAKEKEEAARATAEEAKQKALQNERNRVRQAKEKAERNKLHAEFMAGKPAFIPETNESSWTQVKYYVPPPPGIMFKGDYHKEGVCEKNFDMLAQALTNNIQAHRYYAAYRQLQDCIDQRQSKHNGIRAEKGGNPNADNIKHLTIINGLRALLQEFETGTMDTIQRIEFRAPDFILFRINNQSRRFQVYGGGPKGKKAKTRKAKKSKLRKTRKH